MSKIEIDPDIRYLEGTQRVLSPEATLERTTKLLSSIGVTRIANITDLDRVGIPVFSAIRPSAAAGAISIYSGKGVNETNARISAIMESFERCLAEQPEVSINLPGVQPETQRVVNSYESLSEDYPALFPEALLLPQPFEEFSKIEWIMGHDIMNDIEVFVPANAVFHPYDPGNGVKLFRSNTNGLAAGATNVFHFVVTADKPFTTTNLTAKVSFSHVVLEGGTLADVSKQVTVTPAAK